MMRIPVTLSMALFPHSPLTGELYSDRSHGREQQEQAHSSEQEAGSSDLEHLGRGRETYPLAT